MKCSSGLFAVGSLVKRALQVEMDVAVDDGSRKRAQVVLSRGFWRN
ncbi:MAG: hypothetical protein ACUVTG_00700 [Candidatus Oleimicrobiaceae bacterium]